MTPTTITVRGEYREWFPAERAVVHLDVRLDGGDRNTVFSATTASAALLRDSILAIENEKTGPVTWWSSGSVSVWWDRPWNNEGVQLDPVHHASVNFTVKFSDFDALGPWLESAAAIDGTIVSGVSWDLTTATRTAVTERVRSQSVADAVSKATVFATSIGLDAVSAIALADPGMLGDSSGTGTVEASGYMMKAGMMMSDSSMNGLSFKPEEIEISSVVDARFTAH